MSGATYRIETDYEPSTENDVLPWVARIVRLSDEARLMPAWGETEDIAVRRARSRIAEENIKPHGQTVFVDDMGNDAPLFSVKVEHGYCRDCGTARNFTEGKCDNCAAVKA